jgi:hypothetical protein
LDDIFSTNTFTFPLGMRKQPPSYENIPAWPSPEEKGLPVSKRSKTGRSSKGMRKEVSTEVAGGEVHSFPVATVDVDVFVFTSGCTARALARFLGNKMHISMA